MKKITTLCFVACALTNSGNAFGMLPKQTTHVQKYISCIHTRKPSTNANIKRILLDHEQHARETMNEDWSTVYDAEDLLRDLYFRNNTIIGLLHRNKKGLKAKKILKEQQNVSVRGLGYEEKINALENQLYKLFKVKNKEKHE